MLMCTVCEKPLTGGLDTYGAHNEPMCWDCYAELSSEAGETYYGLAPHVHHVDEQGRMTTEFLPLTDKDKERFMPDPDAPGCGVWSMPG